MDTDTAHSENVYMFDSIWFFIIYIKRLAPRLKLELLELKPSLIKLDLASPQYNSNVTT